MTDSRIVSSQASAGESALVPSFADFAVTVYPFLEMQPFHEVYYRLLEMFAAGRVRRLMVSMPPQHGTSIRATVTLRMLWLANIAVSFSV